MKGAFITIEGADGSGKTTHANFVERCLQERAIEVVRTREPGGTGLGEVLREILLTTDGVPISERAELMLFFAARAQHIAEIITPALAAGKWVLSERFTDATYAYQGGGRGMSMEDIAALEKLTQGELQPDLTMWLEVPPEVGRARVMQTDLTRSDADRLKVDRFEKESLAFNKAVAKVYAQRAAKYKQRIKRIDAEQPIEQVRVELQAVLDAFRRAWQA